MDKWNTDLIFRQTGGPVDLHAKLKAAGYPVKLSAVRAWSRRGSIPVNWVATIARVTGKDPRDWIVAEPEFDPAIDFELEIAARYVRGESGVTIAREMKVPRSRVYAVLDAQGLPRRNRGGLPPERQNEQRERNEAIRNMHKDGFDQAAIARAFGVSRQRVHQIVRDHDNTRRKTSHDQG